MPSFVIKGGEDVYDAFDEFEHTNILEPVTVNTSSLVEAKNAGCRVLQDRVDEDRKRRGCWSTGTFSVGVHEVLDGKGKTLYKKGGYQVFCNSIERDPIGNPLRSGLCISRNCKYITYEAVDVDHEDNRTYTYSATFETKEYREAIATLLKTGTYELHGQKGGTLVMKMANGSVELRLLDSPLPSLTPGGASLSGKCTSTHSITDLLLIDEEG